MGHINKQNEKIEILPFLLAADFFGDIVKNIKSLYRKANETT
jgi:hypothetical protein